MLLQARSSRAKVVGLANAGADTIDAVKQAAEFGVGPRSGQSLVAMLAFINDVHAMGLRAAQDVLLTETFYWDMNEGTHAWSRRFGERMGGNLVPSTNQAGVYSATLAYLRAVAAAGTDDARWVVPEMKRAPFQDPLFGDMAVRQDGRAMHLFEVKKPEESRRPFDHYNLAHTIPGDQAFRPMAEGGCPLAR
ncbi:hypothetical protein GCM10009416_18740 [Craurococcus roseus]|uniref:Leucine-binding protein domain-containing protein n=1 Tax=Craurococcus roseus TaxID=77585 RepID=A0ABN1F2A7_9PROT